MDYTHIVDEQRLDAFTQLIETIDQNIPLGYEKIEQYGGISYVVPLSTYPKGYHVTPDSPLPFLSIIAQKKHIALYHMGMYAVPELLQWFQQQYAQQVPTKLNMGKSCIRFTNIKHIPYALIGELIQKLTPEQWISYYEQQLT